MLPVFSAGESKEVEEMVTALNDIIHLLVTEDRK